MKSTCLALLVFVAVHAGAQSDYRPGYVVMNGGDTVMGFVEYGLRSLHEKECNFRKEMKGVSTFYHPGELSGYGFIDGRHYVTRTLQLDGETRTTFLQRLQSGRINLYILGDKFYVEKDSLFILPKPLKSEVNTPDGIYIREDNLYVGMLNLVFSDCPVQLNRPSYEIRWISKSVESYNRCTGTVIVRRGTTSTWSRINWQLFAGFMHASLTGTSGGGNPSSQTAFAGASIEFSSPAINDKLFFVTEVLYYKILFQTSHEYVGPGYVVRSDFTSKSTNLVIPLGIRYNLRPENQTMYIKGGIALNYMLNPSGSLILEREEAGIVTTNYTASSSESNQSTQVWFGAGYLKSFGPRLNCFLEARFSSQTSISVIAGLRF